MKSYGSFAQLVLLDAPISIIGRCERDLAYILFAPSAGARDVFQHQRAARGCWSRLQRRVAKIGDGRIEKAKTHPSGAAELGAIPNSWLLDFGVEPWMPYFVAASDDRISEVLPDDSQEFAGDLVLATGKRRWPSHMDHRVAAPGQPFDLRQVVEFDGGGRWRV